MKPAPVRRVGSAPLPYLISLPAAAAATPPLLCFLHGYDEGPPTPLEEALTRHGPFAPASASTAIEEFIVVAPQLPVRGDVWHSHADAVQQIVGDVQERHGADPTRAFLTGFSFGGNGVFDLALAQRGFWTALWPVDPTRLPKRDPELPVWLSSGQVSRFFARWFIKRLHLKKLDDSPPGERVYLDQRQNHVGTARLAYRDERIYRWLLNRRPPPA